VFTSGTTNRPKAILHTTNTTRFSSRIIAQTYGITSSDVALSYLPLTTNAGAVWSLYLPLETGLRTALLDRFSAERALSVVEREQVTLFCGSPTALIAMSEKRDASRPGPGRLRLLISSGSSCPPQAIPEIRRRLKASFIEVYGMNELGWATTTTVDDDPATVDGTIGRPYPYVEAKVIGDDGSAVPSGSMGELMLRSPGRSLGYHSNAELTAATWSPDGWLYTGDNATVDDAGNIALVSRKKDMIIRGGANVSPREVEEATLEHPAVDDVAVVGIPDDVYGESVSVCVVLKPGHSLELEELREFLMPRIAFYKIPSRLEVINSMPFTSSGKVRRNVLRDHLLGATSQGQVPTSTLGSNT
jgi:fatty-acyl-CoA synthase